MNHSKLILTFAVVALLHLGAGSVLLMQPGCKSSEDAKSAASPPADAANAQTASTPPSAPAPQLSPPTRPATPIPVASLSSPQEPLTPAANQQINPPFAGASSPSGVIVEYEVKSGDNLTKIGQQFGVTSAQIAAANNMSVGSTLRIGQLLVIPAAAPPAAAAPVLSAPAGANLAVNGTTYTVKSGDVLGAIARQFGTSVPAIQAANNMSGTLIRPGQVLVIPAPGPAATPRPPAPPPAAAVAAASSGEVIYIVREGDSPVTIASAYGVRVAELMALNNISDPRRIRPGQQLRIPSGGTPPAASAQPATPPPASPPPTVEVVPVVPVEVIEVEPPITPVAPN